MILVTTARGYALVFADDKDKKLLVERIRALPRGPQSLAITPKDAVAGTGDALAEIAGRVLVDPKGKRGR